MTERTRRVAALAAVFAPAQATAIVARLAEADTPSGLERARALAAAPRRERLRALADALVPDPGTAVLLAEAAAAAEGPRLASLLRALARGEEPPGVSPGIRRLCREAIGR